MARTHPVTNHLSQTMHTPGRVGNVPEKMVSQEEEEEAGAGGTAGADVAPISAKSPGLGHLLGASRSRRKALHVLCEDGQPHV